MINTFPDKFDAYKNIVESSLLDQYKGVIVTPDLTMEAALYSLSGNSKRIRPILTLAVGDALGIESEKLLPFAGSIEMIHTYSLIHDDLPGMDNDDLRRGRPTCHVKYSEATAILAGDSLLNRAYQILFDTCIEESISVNKLKAAAYICKMAGNEGMIGGQTIDILSEGKDLNPSELKNLHLLKTGGLLKASVLSAVFFSGKDKYFKDFHSFAEHLGLAFQIKDDLLDVTQNAKQLGKSPGKDERDDKSTYVKIFGVDGAAQLLEKESDMTIRALDELRRKGLDTSFLYDLNQYLLQRKK